MSDLSGKKGLILGVGNQRSIAWAMAEQLQQQGAELGLTFLSDPKGRFEANVRKLGDQVGATFIHECDVSIDESIQQMADALKAKWDRLDGPTWPLMHQPFAESIHRCSHRIHG